MADDSGLSEFNASIDAMTKRLSAALPDIVMSAAEIVENEIKARAPKDTGALITALEIAASRRKASASATVQVKDS